jgi:fibronectin-binding autotransporter adhesin
MVTGTALAATDTWNKTAAGTTYSWIDLGNWLSGSSFPNGIGDVANLNIDIVGAQTISLDQVITLGKLNLGDAASGFSAFTINAGTGGSLVFDMSGGTALLERTTVVATGVNDVINANVLLNDPLTVRLAWLSGANGIRINGAISGTGGINLTTPSQPTGSASNPTQFLELTNINNSFTGNVEVANGVLIYRGDVLVNTNGALGNSPEAVKIGNASSHMGTGTPNFQNNTTMELRLQASDDTSNYTFARGMDFSGTSGSGTAGGRARFSFVGDGAGGLNTNTLTISGVVTLASNGRGTEFVVARQGQTMRFTGEILSSAGTKGTVFWGPGSPGSNVDGRNNGTFRFSDVARTYTNSQNLTNGVMVIEGSVGAAGSASPIGTQTISLGDGNGGNIFSAGTDGANRSVFLDTPGTTFARTLSPAAGTAMNFSTSNAANQTRYGTATSVNMMNGYQFGGLNTSGTVTFSGGISPGNVNVAATGTAGGLGGTNAVSVVHNIALIAATGGRTEFTGVISGSTAPVLGSTDVMGAAVAANSTRITINQFRNHQNLDTNIDGVADTNANQLVGTATAGTVVVTGANTYSGGTEILGGTLLVNNTSGSGTGTGAVSVAASAALGGTGSISSTGVSLANLASIRPGDPLSNGGLGEFSIAGSLTFNTSGGSILDFQITRVSDINHDSLASNLNLDGSINWGTVLAAPESLSLNNDKLSVDGDVNAASAGSSTTVMLSATGTGAFAAGMAWDLFEWTGMNNSTSSSYVFNFSALESELAGSNLALDTSRFYDTGYVAVYAAVPEPTKWTLLAGGLACLCLRRRRVGVC